MFSIDIYILENRFFTGKLIRGRQRTWFDAKKRIYSLKLFKNKTIVGTEKN